MINEQHILSMQTLDSSLAVDCKIFQLHTIFIIYVVETCYTYTYRGIYIELIHCEVIKSYGFLPVMLRSWLKTVLYVATVMVTF